MLSRLFIAFGVAAIAHGAAAQAPTPAVDAEPDVSGATVIATVNGEAITVGDIVALRTELPPQYQSLPDRTLYEGLTEQIINQILLSQAAERAGFLDRKDVQRGLEMQRMSYLAELYARDRIDSTLTPDAVELEYNRRYLQEEGATEWNAAHILVEDEATAKIVIEELEAGADFAETAKVRSTGPSGPRGGDLGWFGAGQMVPEFQTGVEGLEVGEISAPIQTQFGWHVIKLMETRKKAPPSLSEVYQELAGEMSRNITDSIVSALRDQATVEFMEGEPGITKLRDDSLIQE